MLVITPAVITAVTAAPVPPPPPENVTVGALVKPVPPVFVGYPGSSRPP